MTRGGATGSTPITATPACSRVRASSPHVIPTSSPSRACPTTVRPPSAVGGRRPEPRRGRHGFTRREAGGARMPREPVRVDDACERSERARGARGIPIARAASAERAGPAASGSPMPSRSRSSIGCELSRPPAVARRTGKRLGDLHPVGRERSLDDEVRCRRDASVGSRPSRSRARRHVRRRSTMRSTPTSRRSVPRARLAPHRSAASRPLVA